MLRPPLLFSDQQAKGVKGFSGGIVNALEIGVSADSRDFAPPFWALPSAGGRQTLKGFRANRLKAKAASNLNAEARVHAYQLAPWGQTFALSPLIFADFARVYDKTSPFEDRGWFRSHGIGFRIAWNQATIIGLEPPLRGEEKSLYVNINHIF